MRKIILCVFFILPLITFFSIDNSYALNLLVNPGFEQGDFPPTSWNDWSGSGSEDPNDGIAGFPVPQELSHSGIKAVGKVLYGTGERWGGFSQTVNLKGPGHLNASAWVMNKKNDVALGGGAKAFIEVKFLDAADLEIRKVKSNSIRSSTRWTKLSLRGMIPSKTEKVIFSFVVTGAKGSRGKVFLDDALLTVGN